MHSRAEKSARLSFWTPMHKGLGISTAFIGLLVVLFFLFYPLHTVLNITAVKTGRLLLCAQMANGEEFVLSFVHSVNKRPVYDTLKVESQHLVIVKSRYDSFGAGMPETSTETSELKFNKDGWMELIVNRPVSEVTLFVGWVANHSLHLKGREITLADLAEPGTPLTFKPAKASLYQMWKGRCLR